MVQHTYDEESVQELLGWAKKMIETKNYPTEKYQVNACTSIIDSKLYLESLISMISKNWENPTFHPTIETATIFFFSSDWYFLLFAGCIYRQTSFSLLSFHR